MPIYLNGRKYVGAYYNGRRVNGYYNGIKLFQYDIPINLTFAWANSYGNESSKTIKVLLKPHMNYSANDLFNAFNAKLTGYGQIPQINSNTSVPNTYSIPNLGEFHTTENYLVDSSGNNLTSEKITLNMNNNQVAIQLAYNGQIEYKSLYLQANQSYDLQNDILPQIGGDPFGNTHLVDNGSVTLNNYGRYTFNEGVYPDTAPVNANFALNTVSVAVNYQNQYPYDQDSNNDGGIQDSSAGDASTTLSLALGSYSLSDIINKFPMMNGFELVGNAGVSDPGSGYSNSSDTINVGWNTNSITIDIVPTNPYISYQPLKVHYDMANANSFPQDEAEVAQMHFSELDGINSSGNQVLVQLPWNASLGTTTLNGSNISTSTSLESTWNGTLNSITMTPTVLNDIKSAWDSFCDSTLKSTVVDPDITDSDDIQNLYKNTMVKANKVSINENRYIPIFNDSYTPPMPNFNVTTTVTNTVEAIDPQGNVIMTWHDCTGDQEASYTPAQWAQDNGVSQINVNGQEYTVDTNPSDPPLDWGFGGSVEQVPYDPVSSPAPQPVQPQIPSSIQVRIEWDNYWTHKEDADSGGMITFPPNPYRGHSYNVTYAEVCYFFNYNEWPDNESSQYYVTDQTPQHTRYYIYNPRWQYPNHGDNGAISVGQIGDREINLLHYQNSTLHIPTTLHKDRSWDLAMGG